MSVTRKILNAVGNALLNFAMGFLGAGIGSLPFRKQPFTPAEWLALWLACAAVGGITMILIPLRPRLEILLQEAWARGSKRRLR